MSSFERPTPTSARARRLYATSPEKLESAVKEAVEKLPRWTLLSSGDGELHAVRRTRFFRFEDDVTARIAGRGSHSEVAFESASRVGKSDLGQNSRNLRELLEAIDRELD